jgi:hypothetical protein
MWHVRQEQNVPVDARTRSSFAVQHGRANAHFPGGLRALCIESAGIQDRGRSQREHHRRGSRPQEFIEFRGYWRTVRRLIPERKTTDPGLRRPVGLRLCQRGRKHRKHTRGGVLPFVDRLARREPEFAPKAIDGIVP